jgi:predicted nucleic acid-binding protein
MILTDTSVVVQFLRVPTPRLLQIIQNSHAGICGATVAEVYAGARSAPDLARLTAALGLFGSVTIPGDLWPKLGHNLFSLRTSGITVPFTDALIATVAIENALELWTYDAHFPLIQNAVPQLKLFHEPP